jgi:tetratricopeptide (TPR) repeat protein
VDAAVAHEIAYRGSVRAVVEGRIDRVGSGYSVVLKVSDVEKGAVLLSVSDAARTQDDLIPTFGRLVRRLLDGLRERRGDVKATREPIVAATPSFEAYRKLVRARHLQTVDSDDRGSIALCREALAIDPDFAAAWMLMGWGFDHLGQTDSLQWAFGEALRRPERLREEERLFLESTLASYLNERAVSLALHDRLVRDYPSPSAYGNRGALLGELGRFEEALQDQEQAVRIEAFVPRQWILYNQFVVLIVLGRLAEAEQVAARLKGTSSALAPLALATAGNQWARAESCATALLADPAVDPEVRAVSALAAASEEAARGRLAASRRFLNQARRAADEVGSEALRRDASRAALLLGVASGGETGPPDRELARDTSLAALVVQGCWSAAAGDVSGARRLLDRVQRYSAQARARLGAGPALLEAWIAGGSGRGEDAAQILGPAARQSIELGFVTDGVGPMPMRWLMGEAWERLAQSDSAAAYFELALTPERVLWEQRLPMRMVSTFAHRRLVLLYARAGRLEEARRHWKAIEETVRTPDPEVARSVDEARLALARAEDAAKSARR